MPHLKGVETSAGAVSASDEALKYHLVAMLTYELGGDFDASLGSEAGQRAVEDLGNFATGGATIVTVDAKSWLQA